MEKYLILARHSLPEVVESLPAREWRLSKEGRARSKRLAERLRSYHPEAVVSSTEPKAMETAEIVANDLELPLQSVNGLHEHDRSKTAYLSRDGFQSAVREFFEKPDTLVFGSETADQTYARFSAAVHSILDQYREKSIVIIAHGTVISLFVSRLTGVSGLSLWRELGLPSFMVIDRESNKLLTKENVI